MKKIICISVVLFVNLSTIAQSRYISRTGHISFFSEAPLENIEAHNYQANGIFDKEKGEVAFSVLMRGFEFEKALMQEHFNENYIESHTYPRASFSGKILNYDQINLEEGHENQIKITGELTIRGIAKKITADGTIQMKNKNIVGQSAFKVRIEDHNIKVPSVVRNNIAEIVDVTVEIIFEPVEN